MLDANFYVFMVSSALYLISIIFLIVFSFKTNNNRLWLIATALFIFAAILGKDSLLSTFLAIFVSGIMLIIFGSRGDIIYTIATVFVLLGAIFSSAINNVFIFAIILVVVYTVLSRFLPSIISSSYAEQNKH